MGMSVGAAGLVWNGTIVPSLDALEGYFKSAAVQEVQPQLHLRPDRRAKYEVVAQVLASGQRNRLKQMGFVNTSEFRTERRLRQQRETSSAFQSHPRRLK